MREKIDYNLENIFWKDVKKIKDNPYLVGDLKNLNCLLLYLTNEKDFSREDYPLPLGYVASLIRMNQGQADIKILDSKAYSSEEFKGYNLIGIYPMVSTIKETLAITDKIKQDNLTTKICLFNSDQHQHEMILCAPDARDYARTLMKKGQSLDYILVGEAEYSFINLCKKVVEKNLDFNEIPACFYREDDTIQESKKPIVPINFKFLPLPSRDFLDKKLSKEGINPISPRVQSSRGCVSPCLYCAESFLNIIYGGRKTALINRHTSKFIEEIDLLNRRYGTIFFNIIDSSFEGSGNKGITRMNDFYDEILKRNLELSFKIHLRPETVTKLEDKFILKMKDAGTDIVILGIESTIEEELKSYKNKNVNILQQITNLERMDSFGKFFNIIGHMMFSANLELDDLPKKVEFMQRVQRDWDYILMSSNLLAFRGTRYHDFLKKSGLERKTDNLTPIIPYRFKDERIEDVAKAMGDIKIKCPEVISLRNALYDSMNLLSREQNKMNEHLWGRKDIVNEFKTDLDEIFRETGKIYSNYLLDLIDLAKKGWEQNKAEEIYKLSMSNFFLKKFEKTKEIMNNFFRGYKEAGLSTNKLYLKTWMSTINSQINTSGGEIES